MSTCIFSTFVLGFVALANISVQITLKSLPHLYAWECHNA